MVNRYRSMRQPSTTTRIRWACIVTPCPRAFPEARAEPRQANAGRQWQIRRFRVAWVVFFDILFPCLAFGRNFQKRGARGISAIGADTAHSAVTLGKSAGRMIKLAASGAESGRMPPVRTDRARHGPRGRVGIPQSAAPQRKNGLHKPLGWLGFVWDQRLPGEWATYGGTLWIVVHS